MVIDGLVHVESRPKHSLCVSPEPSSIHSLVDRTKWQDILQDVLVLLNALPVACSAVCLIRIRDGVVHYSASPFDVVNHAGGDGFP